jgi:hypothetical protein
MTKSPRILNISRNFTLKRNQALKAIDNCACAWVDEGISIRDLNPAEAIAARHQQARNREPLPLAEIHGLTYEQPITATQSIHERYGLVRAANELVAQYAG